MMQNVTGLDLNFDVSELDLMESNLAASKLFDGILFYFIELLLSGIIHKRLNCLFMVFENFQIVKSGVLIDFSDFIDIFR